MIRPRIALENVANYKPGKPIEEVKRELGLKTVYKLASNENPFAPLYLKKAILKELADINRYPEGTCFALRQELAKKHKIDPDCLVFGNGSDELITLAVRAYVEPGDEVVLAYPTFLIYEIQSRLSEAVIKKVPLKDRHYDLEAMAAQITSRTRIVFIANPDNPTGTYLNHKQIEDFLAKAPTDVLVFLDEAYFDFAPKDFPRSKELLSRYKNIVITRTFSKAYALAGVRLGYALTTKEIAASLNKAREPFNINRFAQVAALAALKNKVFLKKVIRHTTLEKKLLYAGLKKLRIKFTPSATNFILVDFGGPAKGVCDYLLGQGVVVREMSGWGFPDYFRVTVGLHKENEKFLKCVKQYIVGAGLACLPVRQVPARKE